MIVTFEKTMFLKGKLAMVLKKNYVNAGRFGNWCALGAITTVTLLTLGRDTFAASGLASASATVIEPVSITATSELVFGVSGVNMARVIILRANFGGAATPSAPTGAVSAPTGMTAKSPADAGTISGDGNASYAVSMPSMVTVSGPGGTQSVAVATSVAGGGASGGAAGGASQTVLIGGTLVAGLSQAQGSYAGTVSVTIEYN